MIEIPIGKVILSTIIIWFLWIMIRGPPRRDCWGGMVYTGKNPPKGFVEIDIKEDGDREK